jgi:hypothetical protein
MFEVRARGPARKPRKYCCLAFPFPNPCNGSQGHRGLEKWRYMCTFTCALVASEWMHGRSQISDLQRPILIMATLQTPRTCLLSIQEASPSQPRYH